MISAFALPSSNFFGRHALTQVTGNNIKGCMGINIYFERDPKLTPDATSCPNPASLTQIKVDSILLYPLDRTLTLQSVCTGEDL